MAPDSFDTEPALVLCHTVLHNAFRTYPEFRFENFQTMLSSQFVARFIIERQSELQEGQFVSFTSQKVFDSFLKTFHLEPQADWTYEMVEVLENLIGIVKNEGINKLDEDESVFAISDILYSRSTRRPVILVSDMPSKTEKALKFYEQANPEIEKIPFEIFTTETTVGFLRGRYTDICNKIDERMRL